MQEDVYDKNSAFISFTHHAATILINNLFMTEKFSSIFLDQNSRKKMVFDNLSWSFLVERKGCFILINIIFNIY